MNTKLTAFVVFLFALFNAAACGQKGPLFLPGSPSQIQSTVEQAESAVASETDEEDEEKDEDII